MIASDFLDHIRPLGTWVDWDNTVAYAQSSATNGINLRAPAGSAQFDWLEAELIEKLMEIRDPETDDQIVVDVMKKGETFAGEHNQRCPDLTLESWGFPRKLLPRPTDLIPCRTGSKCQARRS